ncbi:hypothetical protein FOE67_26665 [Streptomyces calidiresistens]|uniref:Uncharacterized protein n=1 Tax=Streptomyces calidiresistens TaxID=1485586 RepID=A0A7W3T8N8_9ACTN|nr:hypothetical protein [Streptomyces calidiresistens]
MHGETGNPGEPVVATGGLRLTVDETLRPADGVTPQGVIDLSLDLSVGVLAVERQAVPDGEAGETAPGGTGPGETVPEDGAPGDDAREDGAPEDGVGEAAAARTPVTVGTTERVEANR